jgi:hypothetical protein
LRRENFRDILDAERCVGKCFPEVSHPGHERLLQPWAKGAPLFFILETEVGINYVLLVLKGCRF